MFLSTLCTAALNLVMKPTKMLKEKKKKKSKRRKKSGNVIRVTFPSERDFDGVVR